MSSSFNSSLEQEIKRGKEENRMLQFTFQTAVNSVPGEYFEKENNIIYEIATSIKKNISNNRGYMRIFEGDGKVVFSDAEIERDNKLLKNVDKNSAGYTIIKNNNKYYLDVMCAAEAADKFFYLESISDISYVYEERGVLFSSYKIITIILLLTTGAVTLIIAYWLTKSIKSLSKVTKGFAEGNYEVRSEIKSNDEIGMLSDNFNVMADALSEKIEQLSNEARKQEDFTASFVHELKTPLTSIIGYSDMLRSINLSKKEIFEVSNYIYSQGKRLESLSFKLLELLVLKNQTFEFKDLKVKELIKETLIILKELLEKKQISVEVELQNEMIKGDKDLLISLFINIVDNARKACNEGGKIIIIGEKEESEYKISIIDNGAGIPAEDLEKIKEAFYMVDKSRSRKEGGAGMGMTICDEIITLHNAKWNIKSELGKGTCVNVVFYYGEKDYEKEI